MDTGCKRLPGMPRLHPAAEKHNLLSDFTALLWVQLRHFFQGLSSYAISFSNSCLASWEVFTINLQCLTPGVSWPL